MRIISFTLYFSIVFFSSFSHAAIWYVDDDNQTAIKNGSIKAPYQTIQAALDKSASGDKIKVAAGIYQENIIISDKSIELLGGYPGASSSNYNNGITADYSQQNSIQNISLINGNNQSPTITFIYTNASGSTIDGFKITGGYHGILLESDLTWPLLSEIMISNNTIENNGIAETDHAGGGISAQGNKITIRKNTFNNNISGRGAAANLNIEALDFGSNTIINNIAHGDHGGGLYLFGTGSVTHNIIKNNQVGATDGYGWGGGIAILESESMTLKHNIISENYAPSVGGGVFIDDGSDVTMTNELIYRNSVDESGGAGIYVDGLGETGPKSKARIINCTIANNSSTNRNGEKLVGSGLYVEYSDVIVKNSVFWGHGGDDFFIDEQSSSFQVNYSLSQENISGTDNLHIDPEFINAANDDYHLMSTAGYWDSQTKSWKFAATNSPAIDKGNSSSDFSLEKSNNGARINLGAYGNTKEASKSLDAQGQIGTTLKITINDTENYLHLNNTGIYPFKLSLNPDNLNGQNADWWLVQVAPDGVYSYNLNSASFKSGMHTTYQGELFSLSDYKFNVHLNKSGVHRFYFGFDTIMNGKLDFISPKVYYDYIDIKVD